MNLIKRTNIPKKASGIYQIQSKCNGKIYIGSAVNLKERKKNHFQNLKNKKHGNKHLQNHYNKYGKIDLQFSILEFCLKEKLIKREQFYLDTFTPKFNIYKIAGSALGSKHSEETKQKMSKAKIGENNVLFGKLLSEEHKRKISKALTGTHCSEKTKQKMHKANTGKKRSEKSKKKMSEAHIGKNIGKDNPNYGKHPSEETREKQRKSHIGKHPSEETRKKLSKALIGKNAGKDNPNYGKHPSEETRKKLSTSGKEAWKKRKERALKQIEEAN